MVKLTNPKPELETPEPHLHPQWDIRPLKEGEALEHAETVLKRRRETLRSFGDRQAKLRQMKRKVFSPKVGVKMTSLHTILGQARSCREFENRAHFNRLRKAPRFRSKDNNCILAVRNTQKCTSKLGRKMLNETRCAGWNTAVLMRNSEENLKRLRYLDGYLYYGYPSIQHVRELILKKGSLVAGKGEVVKMSAEPQLAKNCIEISDNVLVESRLGHLGVICVEDIIEQIVTGGTHMESVLREMGPFKVNNIKEMEGLEARSFEGGNLKQKINEKMELLI